MLKQCDVPKVAYIEGVKVSALFVRYGFDPIGELCRGGRGMGKPVNIKPVRK
jgi:hypothetical protein